MEDTYLRVKDYLKLYNQDNQMVKILNNTKTKTDLYGCVYKTTNVIKIINKMDHYDANVRIHLVKLKDQSKGVRDLIKDITNNSSNKDEVLVKNILKNATTTNENENGNANLKTRMKDFTPSTNYGKILEDDQYTDPEINDFKNQISISFHSSIKCQLTDSIRFKDAAQIVHTWERSLPTKCSWNFTLEHHLGEGIHLNQLYDFEQKNPEHPAGYFFIIEQIADPTGKLVRNIDKDFFSGYTPTRIHIEFEFKLAFLYEMKEGKEIPIWYRKKKTEQDFEEGSEYESIFTPDREPTFHIDYNNILLNESSRDKKVEYTLEYDINTYETMALPLLAKLQENFKNAGLDPTNVTQDDKVFNLRGFKNKINEDYEGTGGELPNNQIDLES